MAAEIDKLLLKGLRAMRPHSHELMNKSRGVVLEARQGYVKSRYAIDASDGNLNGHLHAGRIGSLIDSISSHCNFLNGDGHVQSTSDMSITYYEVLAVNFL